MSMNISELKEKDWRWRWRLLLMRIHATHAIPVALSHVKCSARVKEEIQTYIVLVALANSPRWSMAYEAKTIK